MTFGKLETVIMLVYDDHFFLKKNKQKKQPQLCHANWGIYIIALVFTNKKGKSALPLSGVFGGKLRVTFHPIE